MSDYDVIVVGGGPAGSTLARRASQQGLGVVLVDKAVFPREKACGGGMQEYIRETLDFNIDEVSQRKVYGFRFFAPSGLMVEITKEKESGDLVMRKDFDHLLLRKAGEAGVEVREGVKITGAEQTTDGVTVTTDQGEEITAKYLAGADGINGVIAKALRFYNGWRGHSAAVCIEVEAEVGKETVERICGVPYSDEGVAFNIYMGPVQYGYAWCFPKRSILSLGAGCRQDKAGNLRKDFNKWLEDFKTEHNLELDIISDTSARIPYSGAVKKTVQNRALLVGDAAGFVNPFSGEGLSGAITSGIFAASALKSAVESDNPKLLRDYEKAWKAKIGGELKAGRSLAKLMYKSKRNMETIIRLGYEDPYIKEIMYKLIGGFDTYKNLKAALIKRVLRKHPKAWLSLYV